MSDQAMWSWITLSQKTSMTGPSEDIIMLFCILFLSEGLVMFWKHLCGFFMHFCIIILAH